MVRPCSHRLTDGLKTEWMAHLCGLCLALRADHGQFARVVTNYDGLIISVLTEAQSVRTPDARRTAGPCPLRGMRTAPVATGEGARLAAAVSLVLASAKVRDHVADRDGMLARGPVAAAARRVAAGWDRAGARTGAELGFDTAVLVDAVDRQTGIESLAGRGTPLLTVTEPTETATAAAFAHTAVLAGRPENAAPLAEAGRLFGRLAHLLDAVEDREADAASGAWNPLTATGTSLTEARRLADDAVRGVRLALHDVRLTDRRLVHVLLAHELDVAVNRAFRAVSCAHEGRVSTPNPPRGGGRPHGGGHLYSGGGASGGGGAGAGSWGSGSGPGGPGGGRRFGEPPPEPERPKGGAPRGERRSFLGGCLAATWLCCSCQICCADTFEGPWSRKRREGAGGDCCPGQNPCGGSQVDAGTATGGDTGCCCSCDCGS
ncbi:DUF5685 family protein [Streptomyces sp. NPDC004609]|uniref:DUF5685 family protein n=1 Tax=Streptomyces sp. NPDC004609 TaxID=3364704 RepID=UPI0036B68424